jgi:hypothetical protein
VPDAPAIHPRRAAPDPPAANTSGRPALPERLPYNTEPPPGEPRSGAFRGVLRHRTVHCLEAALAAAVILEQHGHPPLVLSFESIDELDHVIFVYRHRGRWGSIGRSRDPGLHGRRPVFATPRALALSYVDPYVDFTGRIIGYAVADLRALGDYDWRLSDKNVWKAERMLLDLPHRPIRISDRRIDRLRARYTAFKQQHPALRPALLHGSRAPARAQPVVGAAARRVVRSVEIEVPRGPGHWFGPRLAQRFLEALRQRITAVLLRSDRFLKQRFALRGLLLEDSPGIAQFRSIAARGGLVADDAPEVDIDNERRVAARALRRELGFDRHGLFPRLRRFYRPPCYDKPHAPRAAPRPGPAPRARRRDDRDLPPGASGPHAIRRGDAGRPP